jgi:4-diphosphocytidyl-2-C-methyl-D-erythritol kinase
MNNFTIRSYCKINLSLRVLKRLKNGYHSITSLVTFCNLYDIISISKSKSLKDEIKFSGQFKKGITNINTVSKLLNLLRKKKILNNNFFKINIKKNIPHGSGLGGGSSNAAYLLNYLNTKLKLKLRSKELQIIASEIGFDVPISLEKKNTFLTGKNNQLLRINNKFKLDVLIVYPNLKSSTKKVYKKNKIIGLNSSKINTYVKNNKKLIKYLIKEKNDLENAAIKIHPIIEKVINLIKSQKGCYFSRITGSGSACIGIFSNMHNAINAKRKLKLKYPKYWCVTSKTI